MPAHARPALTLPLLSRVRKWCKTAPEGDTERGGLIEERGRGRKENRCLRLEFEQFELGEEMVLVKISLMMMCVCLIIGIYGCDDDVMMMCVMI